MSKPVWMVITIVLVLLALGIARWVRQQIPASRDGLKNVDRSKLRDLDQDGWGKQDDRKKERGYA